MSDQIPGEFSKIIMINSDLGWAFFGDDLSKIIQLKKNHWQHLDPSSVVIDTIDASWEFSSNSIFAFKNETVIKSGNFYYTTFNDGKGELLFYKKTNDAFLYLLNADGEIQCVKYKIREQASNSFLFQETITNNHGEYGVAFGDIDSDGDDDIYIVDASEGNVLKLYGGNSMLKSRGPSNFIDAADRVNLLGVTRASDATFIYDMGATFADMDNDGDVDVYITSLYDNNMLYKNQKGRKFKEIAKPAGVDGNKTRSNVGIWGDVDNDGDVDLFVTNEDTTNMLFLNNGTGRFRDITQYAGLISTRSGKGAAFGDIDLDGDLDLVVPYFGLRNRIYRNEGIHHKTRLPYFTDMTDPWLPTNPDSLAKTASACLADFDNDGDLDLYFANDFFSIE